MQIGRFFGGLPDALPPRRGEPHGFPDRRGTVSFFSARGGMITSPRPTDVKGADMNQQLVDIVVVLDRSGSMAAGIDDTIGGFNTFLDEQKRAEGLARLTLTQFDHEYEIVYEREDIAKVPPLDRSTYVPRGRTALLDAIGRTISVVGARVASETVADQPWKVVFVIITDGQENASREFNRARVLEMIRKQEKEGGWEFVFLAANQDAIAEAGLIGISADKAAAWSSSKAAYEIYSRKLTTLRTDRDTTALSLDDKDRKDLKPDDDDETPPAVH